MASLCIWNASLIRKVSSTVTFFALVLESSSDLGGDGMFGFQLQLKKLKNKIRDFRLKNEHRMEGETAKKFLTNPSIQQRYQIYPLSDCAVFMACKVK